ncbi:sensor histidine kinase [Acetobacter sacchari]|nr:HAMP domain-containing sensor histidine kinase [Acetobacter sacchari]
MDANLRQRETKAADPTVKAFLAELRDGARATNTLFVDAASMLLCDTACSANLIAVMEQVAAAIRTAVSTGDTSDDSMISAVEACGGGHCAAARVVDSRGVFLGLLCCLWDEEPDGDTLVIGKQALMLHARLLGRFLETASRLAVVEDEAMRRERFIAALTHDLRNPLAAVLAGLRLLERKPDRWNDFVPQMRQSVGRMNRLIDRAFDLVDLQLTGVTSSDGTADGMDEPGASCVDADRADSVSVAKLGDLRVRTPESLILVLREVVEEFRAAQPEVIVTTDFNLLAPVYCDNDRMAQLLASLLSSGRALELAEQTIAVTAVSGPQGFELDVLANPAAEVRDISSHIQDPFDGGSRNDRSLDLGFYVAAIIARLHGGAIVAVREGEATRLIFRIGTNAGPGRQASGSTLGIEDNGSRA